MHWAHIYILNILIVFVKWYNRRHAMVIWKTRVPIRRTDGQMMVNMENAGTNQDGQMMEKSDRQWKIVVTGVHLTWTSGLLFLPCVSLMHWQPVVKMVTAVIVGGHAKEIRA